MRNIKDFQARYDRWKNGERYWDIRGVDLPQYDTGDKNTNQEYIFQRPDGTYYSSPTNSSAFTEDVTPVLKRNLSNPATWDFVGSNTNKKYTTQYTDDQLRQMAQDSMPNAEMIPWIDRAGNKQRSARIIGLSPADPIGSTVVEFAGGLPAWKALDYAGNKLAIDFARDFAFTKFGNWARNKILSNQLNKNIENAALSASYPHASNVLNIMPKRSKSFTNENDGLPWALKDNNWDRQEIQKQFTNGVYDLRNWVMNDQFKINQLLNKTEAENMGLEYIPFWDRPEAIEQLKRYGTSGTIVQRADKNADLGWVDNNTVGGGYIPEYSHIANINLASPFPYAETVTHEGGHTLGMGGPYFNKKLSIRDQLNSADAQQLYLEHKSRQVLNPGYNYNGRDLSEDPYEAVQNIRDVGRELGLSVGQPYPGYNQALKILQNKSLFKNPVKRDIADFLKTDKNSMPNVWKALTGTFFSVPILIKPQMFKKDNEKER